MSPVQAPAVGAVGAAVAVGTSVVVAVVAVAEPEVGASHVPDPLTGNS